MDSEKWPFILADEYCIAVTDGTHDSPRPQTYGRKLITSKHLKGHYIDFNSANWISESDYQKVIARSSVEQWDILFSMIGTVGNVYLERNRFAEYACKNMGIFKLGGNCKKAYWLYYFLKSPQANEYVHANLRGSTQSYIPLGGLRKIPVPVPPDNIRDRVVAILQSLDDKIETNNQINDNLAEQCSTMFHRMFDKYDADSVNYVRLGDIASFKYGSMPKKSKLGSGEYVAFSGYQIVGKYPEKMFSKPQLIIVARGVGGCGDIKYSPANCYLSNLSIAIMADNEAYDDYIYHYLLCHDMKSLNTGSAQPQITVSTLEKYVLPMPPEDELVTFSGVVRPFKAQYRLNLDENRSLSVIRDSLLPRLMSGEIDVSAVRL